MKKGIHPQFYSDAKITDTSSGAVFNIGSTVNSFNVEISSITHPFYTGKQRIVDTDNLVEKFERKIQKVNKTKVINKKQKDLSRRKSSVQMVERKEALSLKDMLKQLK